MSKLWWSLKHLWAGARPGIRLTLSGIAAALVALAIAWVLFVPAANWLAVHDVGSVTGPLRTLRLQTAEDAARGRLLTLGAGVLAAGALLFTARNFALSREGQVTDRYAKAIEQLGSDKLDVRIGGIYAFERVARDSARDHPTVMEVLAAFVREHSHEQWPLPADGQSGAVAMERATRPDVQAAVTVIGRRNRLRDREPVDLSAAHLSRANLAGANLVRANITEANLGIASLADVDLSGADLTNAKLGGATLAYSDLTGADLSGVNFTGPGLGHTQLDFTNFTSTIWPPDRGVPDGWHRDADTGRLKRAPRPVQQTS